MSEEKSTQNTSTNAQPDKTKIREHVHFHLETMKDALLRAQSKYGECLYCGGNLINGHKCRKAR